MFKKFIPFMMLLIISATSFSQQTHPSRSITKAGYLQKSKNQKNGAWILLAGGTALIGTGFLIGDKKESSFGAAATGVIMAGVGVLSAIASIPLFIASARNKRKGMAVSAFIKMENTGVIQRYSIAHNMYPALSVKINFH
jgi:hypothetical protein